MILAAIALSAGAATPAQTADAATTYLLMPRAELLALPTSGAAWASVKSVADSSWSAPNLCNINAQHHLQTFAAALVYARTGVASYALKARAGIMAAMGTQKVGCSNAALALGRQLAAYVLAADFANLSGTEDATFRSWLSAIRTRNIGGHPVWNSLVATHRTSPNNWGAYAGASRIAADLYLGDTTDLGYAARITRGFLGDRSAYAGFTNNLTSAAIAWACSGSVSTYTPMNGSCTKSGINLDGGVAADVSRGGSLRWPPADPGIPYQLEAIQGVGLQTELLYRNGYPDAWHWSSDGLKRAAALVTRSGASGGAGWNGTNTARQMPWLLNLRYGTSIPTQAASMGRAIGFTSWLYGAGAVAGTANGGSGGGGSGGTGGGGTTTTAAPVVSAPVTRLASTTVPTTSVRALVRWSLASSSAGLRRYDFQVSVDGAAFASLALATSTSTARWVILYPGHKYTYRVRAVDRTGHAGAWKNGTRVRGTIVGDGSAGVSYGGSWNLAAQSAYLAGHVHYTRSAASATYHFSGTSLVIVGPRGPLRGKSAIYIDGKYVATIDQLASSFAARRVLYVRTLSSGSHTVVVKALATSGRPMVAIDGFEILTPG